jgi:hypothetical protein
MLWTTEILDLLNLQVGVCVCVIQNLSAWLFQVCFVCVCFWSRKHVFFISIFACLFACTTKDLENFWSEEGLAGLPKGVIESLRKVTPSSGLLSFERFCAGLKICLLRYQVIFRYLKVKIHLYLIISILLSLINRKFPCGLLQLLFWIWKMGQRHHQSLHPYILVVQQQLYAQIMP